MGRFVEEVEDVIILLGVVLLLIEEEGIGGVLLILDLRDSSCEVIVLSSVF